MLDASSGPGQWGVGGAGQAGGGAGSSREAGWVECDLVLA